MTAVIDSAAPPRASPSSFVSTKPVVSTSRMNSRACTTASWPVIASAAISTCCGFVTSLILRACRIISGSTCRRPAVSMITTSASWRSASLRPFFATLTGILALDQTGTPISRRAYEAARRRGRSRSAATAGALALALEVPRELRAAVVFPEPCTPAISHGRPGTAEDEQAVLAAERDGELLVHHLHHLLTRREALHDLFGERARSRTREEVVGHLDGDVGLEQGRAHVGQSVVDLLGVELASRP